ncbi:mono and diacylglycerol lipase [Naviculisporaceae sp. PSN 640]
MGFFGRSKKAKKESPPTSPAASPPTSPSVQQLEWTEPQFQEYQAPPPGPAPKVSQSWYPDEPYQPSPNDPPRLPRSPPGWNEALQNPHALYQPAPYPSIVVTQNHYYLASPPPPPPPAPPVSHHRPRTSHGLPSKLSLGSMLDLAGSLRSGTNVARTSNDALPSWNGYKSQLLNQGAALCDQISDRFNDVMTMIDGDRYTGDERELYSWQPNQSSMRSPSMGNLTGDRGTQRTSRRDHRRDQPKGQTTAVAGAVMSGSCFSKVESYANSRLPMDLPPLKLYIPTYPLLCLAAQYSERVYERPSGDERDTHVDADWRMGTKAMAIKSVPMDYMNTIVFAIRGTATFMDWAVNLNTEPISPQGFLDDPGNLCHSGFLTVARKMITPVARRLRQLLEEDPNRASYSLLITGHSAGGAVAALLYSHMLATSKAAMSELNTLTGCFKRIHCITFGTPPISLIPLQKPANSDSHPQLKKSLFLSFVNEGDPVPRADRAYVRSLMELYASPAPATSSTSSSKSESVPSLTHSNSTGADSGRRRRDKPSKSSLLSTKSSKTSSSKSSGSSRSSRSSGPVWKPPPSTLSCAGRLVVLRSGDPRSRMRGKKTVEERLNEGVVAQITTDDQLREVVWGDPVAHVMKFYAGRIETLAVGAVTAKGY